LSDAIDYLKYEEGTTLLNKHVLSGSINEVVQLRVESRMFIFFKHAP